jgi:hypothetical protein
MSNGSPPPCGGSPPSVSGSLSASSLINLVTSIVLGALGFAGFIDVAQGLLFKSLVTWILSSTTTVDNALVAGGAGVIVAAVTAALAICWWLWSNYSSLSSTPPAGPLGCVAGVINQVQDADLGILTLAHPFIQVVVKKIYWPVVTQVIPPGSPPYVWCASCENCPPSLWPPGTTPSDAGIVGCSPMLPCVYHSQEVVDAALGEAIGGTVGAVAGAILGSLAGILAMAAVGCVVTGPFYLLCIIGAALLGILVALAIVGVMALLGASIGNVAGSTGASDSAPGGVAAGDTAGPSVVLVVGAYVCVTGNLAQVQDLNGSNAIYFAGWIPDSTTHTVVDQTQSNGNGTTVSGNSNAPGPDFCHTDPDFNIQGDPCAPPAPPST